MALTDSGNATGMYMPVAPAYGGGYGNGGGFGFGGDWAWILLLLILGGNGWGFGGFGGGGMMWPMMMGGMGGFGIDYLYPWLNNSEHISEGFRGNQLSNQISGLRSDVTGGFSDVQLGIAGLGRQICETGNGISGAVRDGFYGAEVAAQGRHNSLTGQLYQSEINALNRSFDEQIANMQGFNSVNAGLADAKYVEATEACATRTANAQNTRDIIDNQNRVGQSILDKLCQLELDNYKTQLASAQRDNASLQNQVILATERADRTAQTAQILAGQTAQTDAIYNRFSSCPVGTVPVAGNTPLFTCNPGFNNGNNCGCGNNGFVA